MEQLIVNKDNLRDTASITGLGMLAYRIFPETGHINIQLLSDGQEECTIVCRDGEEFSLRGEVIRLIVK